MPDQPEDLRDPAPQQQPSSGRALKTLDSAELFEGGRTEVLIRHDGSLYRLKITRQGKLILNK